MSCSYCDLDQHHADCPNNQSVHLKEHAKSLWWSGFYDGCSGDQDVDYKESPAYILGFNRARSEQILQKSQHPVIQYEILTDEQLVELFNIADTHTPEALLDYLSSCTTPHHFVASVCQEVIRMRNITIEKNSANQSYFIRHIE